jgi:hypothetical protein
MARPPASDEKNLAPVTCVCSHLGSLPAPRGSRASSSLLLPDVIYPWQPICVPLRGTVNRRELAKLSLLEGHSGAV